MKQKELEILLQKVLPHPDPRPELEQYQTPANIAAEALYFALSQGDIQGKKVADMGCGTGILAIGAKLLGAEDVVAVDADERAVEMAMKNADALGVDIGLLTMDIDGFPEHCDTVIMNPPFGAQKANLHADSKFLDRALELGDVVYSFHKAETQRFVKEKAEALGKRITHVLKFRFPIPHIFDFHRHETEDVDIVLVRIAR